MPGRASHSLLEKGDQHLLHLFTQVTCCQQVTQQRAGQRPERILVEMRGRDRPECVSFCIFTNVSGKRQKNPSAGYSQRGERAWGRGQAFLFFYLYFLQ